MPVLAVIPARLGSTRLPQKPLKLLAGEPLVVRVAQHVQEMGLADRIVIATDAAEIEARVRHAGFEAVMSSPSHVSGSDRVAEVAARGPFAGFDRILNVQGDEPFLPREAVAGALARLDLGDEIGTAAAPLEFAAAEDSSRVKVVTDAQGRALYFSRARIPARRDGSGGGGAGYWHHLGLYAFRREALARWRTLPACPLEEAEQLEQLRALYHGMRVGVALLTQAVPPGIDTPEDLARAERLWHQRHEALR